MRRLGSAVLLTALITLTGCAEVTKTTAATVLGHRIVADHVTSALDAYEASPEFEKLAADGEPGSFARRFEQTYLAQLIRRYVFEAAAARLGIEITVIDVHDRIEQIKSNYPNDEAFEEELEERGVSGAQVDQLVRDALIEERLRVEVTEEAGTSEAELRSFYDENRARFRQTRARHILVQDQLLAQQIYTELTAEGVDVDERFAALAENHSIDDRSADDGGDLGYFAPGSLPPSFEQAVDQLDLGELSTPVQTDFGFHVIQVIDRRIAPFDAVRADLEAELSTPLKDQAWNDWVVEQYRKADIEVNPRYGEFDIATQQIADPTAASIPGAVRGPQPSLPGPSAAPE